jgi:hypothetical protein
MNNQYLQDLIFDRTIADVQNLTDKAYIDYKDLNRVEMAIMWVSYVLNQYGYRNVTNNKVNWKPGDHRTDTEMERLRKNIVSIRTAFFAHNETPVTPSKITYTSIYQANAIEQIIYDIGTIVENMTPGQQHLSFRLGTAPIGNRGEKI